MSATIPSPDSWAAATGAKDARPVIYRYRMNRPHGADWRSFPLALSVRWPYDVNTQNGMPPAADNEQQCEFEDAIISIGEGHEGSLMLVTTGNGEKQWLFFVQDPEAWIATLNERLTGHDRYPLEIDHWPDAEWTTWHEFIALIKQSPKTPKSESKYSRWLRWM